MNRITGIPFRVWFPQVYITLAVGSSVLFGVFGLAKTFFDTGPNGFLSDLAIAAPNKELNLTGLFSYAVAWFTIPAAVLSFVCVISIMAMNMANFIKGSPVGYGRLSLLDHLLLRIRSTEMPPSVSQVHDVTYSCAPPIRHCSVYENPDAVRDIAVWIAKRSLKAD